jgi:hypothetical protein
VGERREQPIERVTSLRYGYAMPQPSVSLILLQIDFIDVGEGMVKFAVRDRYSPVLDNDLWLFGATRTGGLSSR